MEENKSKNQILFVDDEPMVLEGLRRMLHTLREDWEMSFAPSGLEALAQAERKQFDVIVSDMRMPGMDGVQLLNEIKKRYPKMVRVALSGQTSKESVIRSVGPIHHYLPKPCHGERLKTTLQRVCDLRKLLEVEELQGLILEMESLPSLPSYYYDLLAEINSPEASLKKIGDIISRDIGMSVKILQLVNSAFFGLRRHITNPTEATTALGLDTIKLLVLSVHVFTVFEKSKIDTFALNRLWDHCMTVSFHARQIAQQQTTDSKITDCAFLAGMFHDLGKIILADKFPETYQRILENARRRKIPILDAEQEQLKTTHAAIGAYLLGLWGFCDAIIEAVAYHHRPQLAPAKTFSALTAVHLANAWNVEISYPEEKYMHAPIDETYLAELNITHRVAEWKTLTSSLMEEPIS
jgi:putative nucleotidyltransferase with HDIG domain